MAAAPVPLFDLFIDLPYPASDSSKIKKPPVVLPPPTPSATADELKSGNGIARIARFAFPEHHDQAYAGELQALKAREQASGGLCDAGLNRHDVYMQNFAMSNHLTFAMQLANGIQVYGHVRRYLQTHPDVKTRHDVGRRHPRASVVLTRYAGGDAFFASALKTVDALWCCAAATYATPGGPVRDFWYGLHGQHAKAAASFAATSTSTSFRARSPVFLSMNGLEFGQNLPTSTTVDTTRMLVPQVLLRHHPGYSAYAYPSSSILPLVRCLGVPLSIRLLSALLSERRIILLSNSPSRLSTVCRGALSLLAQGMIDWPHPYVPILPPGLFKVVAAPNPYLLGILSRHAGNLANAPGLGEVFTVDLDAKSFQTYNCKSPDTFVPDLLRPTFQVGDPTQYQTFQSPAEVLARDLEDILKADRRFMVMKTASMERMGNAQEKLEKGRVVAKKTFGKMKKMFANAGRVSGPTGAVDDDELFEAQMQNNEDQTPDEPADTFSSDSYEYSEGFPNESCEVDCRVALATFFLTLLGDMTWYFIKPAGGGTTPTLDPKKYVTSLRSIGVIEGSPMFPLMNRFASGQLLQKFAKERVAEIQRKEPVRPDAPLFLLAANHCRVKRIEFNMTNVRSVARQLNEQSSSESKFLQRKTDDIRKCGASLTSSKGFDGNATTALSQMIEDAHETSRALVDVMSVILNRLDDSKGMMWKHGLLALQVLKYVLIKGPLAVVCEATDIIEKIRDFRAYESTMRANNRAEVQAAATEVYVLLVDRARLFRLRREVAEQRRKEKVGIKAPPKKRAPVRLNMGFKNLHNALRPASVAPTPGRAAPQMHMTAATTNLLNKSLAPGAMASAAPAFAAPASPAYANDLLGLDFSAPAAPPPAAPAAPVSPAPVAPPPAAPPAFAMPPAPAAAPMPQAPVAPPPAAPAAPTPAFAMPPAPAPVPPVAPAPVPTGANAFNMMGLSQATPTVSTPATSTMQYGYASQAPPAVKPQAPPVSTAQPQTSFGAPVMGKPAQVPMTAAPYPTMAQQQAPTQMGQPPMQQYPGYPPPAASATPGISPYPAAPAPAPQPQQFGYQQQPSPTNAPQQQQRNAFSQFDPMAR